MKISTLSGADRSCRGFARISSKDKLILSLVFVLIQVLYASSYSVKQGYSVSTTTVMRRHKPSELIFYEDFFELDTSVWERVNAPSGWKNGEFQKYSDNDQNSYVRDGILYIRPTYIDDSYDFEQSEYHLGDKDNSNVTSRKSKRKVNSKRQNFEPIVSARLNTREAFAFKYGKLEVSAKVPEGDWIWPAIWLLPQQYWYGVWPNSGEIDLMECRGNRELFNSAKEDIGSNQFGSTLHFGINRTTDMWRLAHFKRNLQEGWNSQFHTYGMIWSPEEFVFTIDGEILGIVTPPAGGFWEMGNFTDEKIWSENKISPFDQPFHIVLNVAVGGTFGYWPDNTSPKRKPWNNKSPTALLDFWEARDEWQRTWKGEDSALQVDFIKIWSL